MYWDTEGIKNEIHSSGTIITFSSKVQIIYQSKGKHRLASIISPKDRAVEISSNGKT